MNNRDIELLNNFQYRELTKEESSEFKLRYREDAEFKDIADGIGYQIAAMATFAKVKEQDEKVNKAREAKRALTIKMIKRAVAAAVVVMVGYIGITRYTSYQDSTLVENSIVLASISEELPSLHRGTTTNSYITNGYNLYAEATALEDTTISNPLLRRAAAEFQRGYFLNPSSYKRAAYNSGVALFKAKDYWKSEMMFRYTLEEYQRSTSNIDTYEEAMSYLRLAIIEINKDPNSIQSEESIAHLKKNSSDIESFLPNNYIDPFYKLIIGR